MLQSYKGKKVEKHNNRVSAFTSKAVHKKADGKPVNYPTLKGRVSLEA
jgi:hypothetical protein